MPLSITYNPAKNYSADNTYTEIVSRWVASDSPIVFKISNTKFPVNSDDTQFLVSTVTETGAGLSEIVMSSDHDLFVGQYIKVNGFTTTEYNGTFKVLDTPEADSIVIGVAFDDNFAFSAGAFVQRTYLNYHNRVRVYAGIPAGHRWQILKPMVEIGIVKSEPNSGNVSVFDIQEYVQAQISTPIVNDLSLVSLPNDVNLWTAFYIEYNEVYTDFAGGNGTVFNITAYADSGGNAQFTLSGTNFDFQIGDSVVLSGFTESIYNRVWEVVEVNESAQTVTINYPYDVYFSLYGGEQAEGFSRSLRTVESAYTTDADTYYASKARVPFGNSYLQQALGNNLAQYLNIDPAETDDLAIWPTDFTDIAVFEGKYFDLTHYIDKSLTDSLAADEQISLEIKEFDFAGALLATQYYKMNNQEEGVWRMPFLGSPPLPAPLAIIVQSDVAFGYVKITDGTTTVESDTGNAVFLTEEGASITITLQGGDNTLSAANTVLWAGVGDPSTPDDGGAWSLTDQAFPVGQTSGGQIEIEKEVTFIVTQTNTIDADFFNVFAELVERHYQVNGSTKFNDIATNYDSTITSIVEDTNAPSVTVSQIDDLVARDGTHTDLTNPATGKANQSAYDSEGVIIVNGTSAPYTAGNWTDVNDVYSDYYNAGRRGTAKGFTVPNTDAPALNGAGYLDAYFLQFIVYKATDGTSTAHNPARPVVGHGGVSGGAGYNEEYVQVGRSKNTAPAGMHMHYADARNRGWDGAVPIDLTLDPYPIDTTSYYIYNKRPPYLNGTQYNVKRAYVYMKNGAAGVISDGVSLPAVESVNGLSWATWGGTRTQGLAGTTGGFDCKIAEHLSIRAIITAEQWQDIIDRMENEYSI